MAVYKIFPLQDASIYSAYPFLNTGLDAILETSNINSNFSASAEVARSIIQFDQSEIENIIDTYVSSSNRAASQFSSSLKVFIADASGITMPSKIESFPISGSWNNGSG